MGTLTVPYSTLWREIGLEIRSFSRPFENAAEGLQDTRATCSFDSSEGFRQGCMEGSVPYKLDGYKTIPIIPRNTWGKSWGFSVPHGMEDVDLIEHFKSYGGGMALVYKGNSTLVNDIEVAVDLLSKGRKEVWIVPERYTIDKNNVRNFSFLLSPKEFSSCNMNTLLHGYKWSTHVYSNTASSQNLTMKAIEKGHNKIPLKFRFNSVCGFESNEHKLFLQVEDKNTCIEAKFAYKLSLADSNEWDELVKSLSPKSRKPRKPAPITVSNIKDIHWRLTRNYIQMVSQDVLDSWRINLCRSLNAETVVGMTLDMLEQAKKLGIANKLHYQTPTNIQKSDINTKEYQGPNLDMWLYKLLQKALKPAAIDKMKTLFDAEEVDLLVKEYKKIRSRYGLKWRRWYNKKENE